MSSLMNRVSEHRCFSRIEFEGEGGEREEILRDVKPSRSFPKERKAIEELDESTWKSIFVFPIKLDVILRRLKVVFKVKQCLSETRWSVTESYSYSSCLESCPRSQKFLDNLKKNLASTKRSFPPCFRGWKLAVESEICRNFAFERSVSFSSFDLFDSGTLISLSFEDGTRSQARKIVQSFANFFLRYVRSTRRVTMADVRGTDAIIMRHAYIRRAQEIFEILSSLCWYVR